MNRRMCVQSEHECSCCPSLGVPPGIRCSLEGLVPQCHVHGLRFTLASGYLHNYTAIQIAAYPVEVIDDEVCTEPGEVAA